MSAETAAVLDGAANVIRRNGWHKGNMFAALTSKKAEDCPVCAWGALAIAVCGRPELPTNKDLREVLPAARSLAKFLRLGTAGDDAMWTVPDWNDAPERTADDVIAALEGAAQAEREAAA